MSLLGYNTINSTPGFGVFLSFVSTDALKLCQIGLGPSGDNHVHVSSGMFDWVHVRAEPLKDIQRVVLIVCYGSLSRWTVNPSAKSEFLRALDRVFTQDISVPSTLTSLPFPAAEKHPQLDA